MQMLHSSKRNYALDFLKCIATIAIVFHHYQQETGAMFRYNFWGGWFYWGYIVELFFLISGYVICRYVPVIYQGKMSLKQWTLKRTMRCIPMMAAGALAYEVFLYINNNVCGLSWSGITPTLWGTVIASLGLQANGFFANPWVNNPAWYISVLFLCYVLFYLVTALARKWKVSPAYFYIAMVLLGCGIEVYGLNWLILDGQLARGYRGFFFGLLLAMQIEKQGGRPSGKLCLLSGATLVNGYAGICFRQDASGKQRAVYRDVSGVPGADCYAGNPRSQAHFFLADLGRMGKGFLRCLHFPCPADDFGECIDLCHGLVAGLF